MKRYLFYFARLILLVTYSFSLQAQQSDKTNWKKIKQQKLETWSLINKHVFWTDPDSALTFYKGLIPDFYNSGCLWASQAVAYYRRMENDQACLHYYLADEFGHEKTKDALNKMNCQSWQNEWIKLVAQYEEHENGDDLNEVHILKFRRRRAAFLFLLKENDWCWLWHKGQQMEVKFLRMKNYVFGLGLHFISRDGLHLFKVYHSEFPETIKPLQENNRLAKQ